MKRNSVLHALALAATLVAAACATHQPVRDEVRALRIERDPVKAEAKAQHKAERIEIRQYRTSVAAAALSAGAQAMAEGSQAPSSSAPAYAATGSTALLLYADNRERTFLGCLNCNEYDSNSVWNEFGTYGSEFSSTSIRNEFSQFGSEFSSLSPCNEFASNPPLIVDKAGNYYGRLTINEFATDANDSDAIRRMARLLCIH